jgi:hypothetical protein
VTDELKPCPFCAGTPELHDGECSDYGWWRAVCRNCDAEICCQTEAETVARWNTRALLAAPAEPVAPPTLADVLDALNVFNKPRAYGEPWTDKDAIAVVALPQFIHDVGRAWYASPKVEAPPPDSLDSTERAGEAVLRPVPTPSVELDAKRYKFWREFYRSQFAVSGRHKLSFMPSRPQVEIAGPNYENAVDAALDAAMETAVEALQKVRVYEGQDALPRGWLEAAIAWEVCASLHREYCEGRDPFYKTRQADFVKHANDARNYHAALAMQLPTATEAVAALHAASQVEPIKAAAPLSERLISSGPNAGRVKREYTRPQVEAPAEPVARLIVAAGAAVSALRSFQYGNASDEFAKEMADRLSAALADLPAAPES